MTTWITWVEGLIEPDDSATAAKRAGFDKSAFSRWRRGATVDPRMAVALARAYGANPVEALVASGCITQCEGRLRTRSSRDALREVGLDALLNEIRDRVHSARAEAADDTHPTAQLQVAAKRAPSVGEAIRDAQDHDAFDDVTEWREADLDEVIPPPRS